MDVLCTKFSKKGADEAFQIEFEGRDHRCERLRVQQMESLDNPQRKNQCPTPDLHKIMA
jgi:hypothetical protein